MLLLFIYELMHSRHTFLVYRSLIKNAYFLLTNNSFTLCLCYLQGMFLLRQICQISEEKFESQLKDINLLAAL